MQIVSLEDNLHEMSDPVFGLNMKNISKCRQLKILGIKITMVSYLNCVHKQILLKQDLTLTSKNLQKLFLLHE